MVRSDENTCPKDTQRWPIETHVPDIKWRSLQTPQNELSFPSLLQFHVGSGGCSGYKRYFCMIAKTSGPVWWPFYGNSCGQACVFSIYLFQPAVIKGSESAISRQFRSHCSYKSFYLFCLSKCYLSVSALVPRDYYFINT